MHIVNCAPDARVAVPFSAQQLDIMASGCQDDMLGTVTVHGKHTQALWSRSWNTVDEHLTWKAANSVPLLWSSLAVAFSMTVGICACRTPSQYSISLSSLRGAP